MGIVCDLFRNIGEGEFFKTHDEPPMRCIKIKPKGIKHGGVNAYCLDIKEWVICEPTEAVVPDSMLVAEQRILSNGCVFDPQMVKEIAKNARHLKTKGDK